MGGSSKMMTYIVHTDGRVRNFVRGMLKGQDVSQTILDSLSLYDLQGIEDGDVVYGTLQISQMLLADASFTYFNVVPPKPDKNNWKVWHYEIKRFNEENLSKDVPTVTKKDDDGNDIEVPSKAGIFLIDHEEFEVEAA